MGKHKIDHDRPNCIGCGACVAIFPEAWEMSPEDGKSICKKPEFDDPDFKKHLEAAQSCPVNVIHLLKEKKEKII